MAEPITNLRNRPQATEYAVEQAGRGPGQLDSINAYLRNDPISYFYQKLSDDKNEFLRDDFWSEAAKRGESENLVGLLQMTSQENFSREAIDAISGYGTRVDYDAYMLALQLSHLDNVEKKKRIDEDQYDAEGNLISSGTGYEFGEYTDQEWAWEILKHTMGRWDAEIIEEDKANRGWLANLGTQVVSGLTNIVGGVFQFVGDIWNLGEGLLNMMFNWSNDADVGARFLQAFSNDSESWSNPFARAGEWLNAASFEFQRLYATTVNAVEAYDAGYRLGEGSNFFTQIDRSVGVGAGYTTWGRWMNAGTNAIGYMVPTILLAIATGGASTAANAASAAGKVVSVGTKVLAVINKARSVIFYTGIFSGMMKDTVMNAQMNGISYRDLDAGKVVANAALKAAAQYAVEKALGMVLGFSGLDRILGMGGKTIAKAGTGAATATVAGGLKAAGRVVATGAKNAIKEGLEEVFQELSDIAIDYAFGGTYRERAIENLSIQTITDAFIVGALTSAVMGSLRNVTTFIGTNRGIGVDTDGNTFKLGAFQTINLREAIGQMHEWNEAINKKGGSVESKAKAMLSMNAAIATLGDVYKNMGTERALKADAMIMEMLNMENKTEQIAALGSNIKYTNKVWADFKRAQAEATAKYVKQKTEDKIKKALEKEAPKLKDKKVTEISDVVTTETVSNDPAIPIEQDATDKLKKALKALGVEAIVGVNGNIVLKSDEVVFANNRLVQAGDIENIVKGVAYDLALETVKANLNPSQKKMIIDAYSKVTGVEGTLDDATMALLFDKQFYTFILLKSKERRYKTAAFEVLATIDKLIKNKLTSNIKNGTITESAYKTLLAKVQKTMRTGLVTFATHYSMIDLGLIDNAVLPVELKQEITNHKNVRFTQTINDGVADRTNTKPSLDRIAAFDEAIGKFTSAITTEEMNWAKEKARSSNYNDRIDAYTFLVYQTKKGLDYADKVIFLPSDIENVEENIFIQEVANDFGVAWTDLIAGTYNPNSLPVEIQNFIQSNGYDMSDTQSRFSAIRDVLFNKSGKTLTVGMDGTVVRVLDKTEFASERYLGPKGQKNLHADLKNGKVKTLQDLSKVTLDKRIGSLKLILDPSSVRPGINGYYIDGSGQIVLAGTDILNTIMHEATHATQFELSVGVETIQGGTADTFSLLPQKVQDSLTKYLKANFELTYTTLKNPDTTNSQVLYFMLAGELQANASLSSFMFEVGFRWKDNRTKLVSPDGKMEWSMTPSKRRASAALQQVLQSAREQQTPKPPKPASGGAEGDLAATTPIDSLTQGMNEDSKLTETARARLARDPGIQNYMKDGWLKRRDGSPFVWYRGGSSQQSFNNQQRADRANAIGEFYASNYEVAKHTYDRGLTQGYISNITKANTLYVNASGADWSNLDKVVKASDKKVLEDFNKKYDNILQIILSTESALSPVSDLETIVRKSLKTDHQLLDKALTEIMADYNLSRDMALKALASTAAYGRRKHIMTDTLLVIGLLSGKDGVVIENVVEDGVRTTDLGLISNKHQKRVTFENQDINWDKVGGTDSRYISNKIARESNLKYFIKKGVPIQMHPRVAAFVSATTVDFNKLPKLLQTKITNGKLNLFDIINYVATTSNMNDYTFKAIAKYVYNNTELAKITYKDARVIMRNVEELAMLANLPNSEIDKHMTPSQMVDLLAETMESAKTDRALSKMVLKATKTAQTVKLVGKEGKSYFTESHAEGKQLNPILFRHYNGTLQSVRSINNLSKFMLAQQTDLEFREDVDTGKIASSNKQWNWIDKLKKAEVDYEQDSGVVDALEDIDRSDKEKVIGMYVSNEISRRLESLPLAERQAKAAAAMKQLQRVLNTISNLSEEALNKRYLAVLANEGSKPTGNKLEGIVKPETEAPRSIKNVKDHLRQTARTVTKRIAGLKRRYNSLPQSIRNAIDPTTYKLNDTYRNMEGPELESLLTDMKEAAKRLNTIIKNTELRKQQAELAQERMARMAKKRKVDNKGQNVDPNKKQTMREKINIVHKTKVINQEFTFESREEITSVAKKLLSTQWGEQRKSQVQGLTNNQSQNVHNGKVFFEQNAVTLLSQSVGEAEATAKWFMDANMTGVAADSIESQTFQAVKLYYLGHVLSEIKDGGQFYGINPNTKTRIENHLRSNITNAGTALAVWNNIQGLINPIDAMKNADMEIAGVILTDTEKEALMNAAVSGDMDAILKAQKEIIDRVNKEKTTKKGILRKITTVRSMAMLSSPMTWLRNVISNMLLKRLNKASSAIGNKVFTKKTAAGQFKMDGKITPEIQAFINEHFIDNKMFDTLVSNLSKYNPSDIQQRFKDATGQASKDAIFANMVIKSMYNQFYNQNMFKSPAMNKLHQSLMKVLSDNNYVREASIRYFGKIIAERGYEVVEHNDDGTIKKNDKGKVVTKPVTDAIMTDFANAIGMGMADYMHSDNIFNKVETLLAEKSEGALFAYKTLLPFAAASWNWFKAAIRYSPIGLGQSIFKLATLEKQIIKAETDWAKGKGQISPEMTEFLIRRNLGSGVIGTIAFGFGVILAGLGYVDLEDDDYGTPKLRIGNLRIDTSTIFGSSSALAGMALVKGWQNGGFLESIDSMLDPLLDGFFLTQILEMDQYSQGGFASFGLGFLEQTILSFIPNGIRWLSGATYSGKYKTTNMFERAVTRIPFLGAAFNVPKQTNPYTGDQGSMWDAFNRVVPFLEVRKTSAIEENAKALGINKTQLRGKYEINGEKFELSTKDTAELNKQYGEWNALALSLFYDNKSAYSVQTPNGTYRTLTYNQMTEDQRKRAVQNIMSKNAGYAKIQAWLKAGNTYYASASDYAALRKLGITGNLYKGNKGFVKK